MSMTPEDLQALSEARGRPRTAPARDFTAEIAAAYAPKEAAYGLSTPQAVNPNLVTEASGLYGDTATSQYIRDLQAGVNVGAGTSNNVTQPSTFLLSKANEHKQPQQMCRE
jgi:hypothetical protein